MYIYYILHFSVFGLNYHKPINTTLAPAVAMDCKCRLLC